MQHLSRPAGQARTTLRKETTNSVIRDAKGLSLELKGMLKRKDPWDREVEFQRAALRKAYLHIIFAPHVPTNYSTADALATTPSSHTSPVKPPSTSHTSRLLDVLNLLWLQTSHAVIHVYRAKVAEMEKAIAEAPNAHRGGRGRGGLAGGGGGGRANSAPGPTSRRRLIHSFRAFLGAEEEFFRTLLSRLATSLLPPDLAGLRALGVTIPSAQADDGEEQEELSPEEKLARRIGAVPLAHKALICFGDLARYRELYNEPGAGTPNPVAGGGGRRDKGSKGTKSKPEGERKVKNWSRAAECYHQARLLLPDNGNPSNQLAVLAQYANDPLSSTYHYYRALSVRSPFPTARTNLDITYAKAVSRWFSEGGGEPEGDEGVKFRAAFVVLHGLFFIKARVEDIPALSARVQELFYASVEQRLLSSDMIVKTVVTGLSALWNARMFRSAATKPTTERQTDANLPSTPVNLEPDLLVHVLSFYSILLTVGTSETHELVASNLASGTDTSESLALNISAILRRTLPAVRILSKWIMGQLEYITRVEARIEAQETKQSESTTDSGESSGPVNSVVSLSNVRESLNAFWTSYVEFANAMQVAFPPARLPNALDGGVFLEEDVDMLGFAPLRIRGTKERSGGAMGVPVEIERVGKDVHPNEEQLMRIADVQSDALLVSAAETSPISVVDGKFVVQVHEDSLESSDARDPGVSGRLAGIYSIQVVDEEADEDDEEDEFGGEEEATEDDPVDLAMRVATADRMIMDGEDEDEDEEIVYQSLSSSQLLNQGSPRSLPRPASLFPPTAAAGSRNAGDLLHQVLSGNGPSPTHLPATGPSPPTASRSIWAPTAGSATRPPATAESFESLPNVTHQAFGSPGAPQAGAAAVWAQPSRSLAPSRHPSFSATSAPPPGFPSAQATTAPPPGFPAASSLFGNFSPFTTPSRPLPLPGSFSSSPQNSDLSPHANPFSRSPQRGATGYATGQASGWPEMGRQTPYPPQAFPPPFAGPPPLHHHDGTGFG